MKPTISCITVLCTLSFRNCKAAVFSVDARRFRNQNDDFINAPALSEGCTFSPKSVKELK